MDFHSRRITAILENALREDSATRDATSYAVVEAQQRGTGTIMAKQDCILSGIGIVPRILDVFAVLDGTVVAHPEVTSHPEIFDGVRLHRGQTIGIIRHNARVILSCERVILNFLQRMSGIATLTRKFVDKIAGTKARILDTRKTVPGLRILDKYAVTCGGGHNHRLDLSDARAREALRAGCLLTIDSDAHRIEELEFQRWGVAQARRAWVEPDRVLTTRSRADLLAWVAAKPERLAG